MHEGALGECGAPPGPLIVVLMRPDLLALIPVHGTDGAELDLLSRCGDAFAAFPASQRRWSASAVLEVRLLAAVHAVAAQMAAGELARGDVSLYLNGHFEHKALAAASIAAPAALAAPDESCRNPIRDPGGILRAFGTASVLDLSLDRSPDQESYYCYSRHTRLLGIGRGTTDRQMMLGAVLEYLERWAASSLPESAVHGAWRDFPGRALRPAHVLGLSEDVCAAAFPDFTEVRRMPWLPCTLEHSGEEALIPVQMVNYLLPTDVPVGFNTNSSGCALGNCRDEAALFAALEVIERDALLLTWYSKSAPPRIVLDSISDQTTRELLMLLDLCGYEVRCFDVTVEFEVPSVMAVLLGREAGNLAVFVTAASHPSPVLALRSALAEAKSLIRTAERNFRRRQAALAAAQADHSVLGEDNQLLYYAHREHLHHFDFLLAAQESLGYDDYLATYPFAAQRPAEAYRALKERMRALGYPLLVCDNTVPMMRPFGLSSVRAFIPGTINMVFGDHPIHLPQGRLARAAASRPWVRDVPVPVHPQLHPLG
ncbi:YcaO-like family protein [Massilia consociata]|uniref:YcaO-like family protein n=1 Tax=Massilia consociata TaxID=760117 RepID=A0ABV6FFD6_9BURK